MALVRYHGRLADLTGCREEPIDGTNVSRLLDQIKKIIVDKRSAGAEKGFRTPTGPDSVVEFIPVCGGG